MSKFTEKQRERMAKRRENLLAQGRRRYEAQLTQTRGNFVWARATITSDGYAMPTGEEVVGKLNLDHNDPMFGSLELLIKGSDGITHRRIFSPYQMEKPIPLNKKEIFAAKLAGKIYE